MKLNQAVARAEKSLLILQKIDKLLTELKRVDPYGDLTENFAEYPNKCPLVTKRLIKMIKEDLQGAYFSKYNLDFQE